MMMHYMVLMFILIGSITGQIVLSDFQQDALTQHNIERQIHCTGPMILNSTLNSIAQNYSEYLAANQIFVHSGHPGLGENLWALFSTAAITFVNGTAPTLDWYNEIVYYNYSNPVFSSNTGHFTQVIWVNSVQMGIGISLTNDSLQAYVVANYYPAGNVVGSFATNVLPPCTNTTTTVASGTTSSVGTTTTTGTSGTTSSAGTTTTGASGTTSSVGTTTTGASGTTSSVGTTTTRKNTAVFESQLNVHLSMIAMTISTLYNLFLQ